uniref:Capsid protein n=1 Tax=Macrostomum lignano TaxID=282301 RepID=A0A1I8F4G9_9PLAT
QQWPTSGPASFTHARCTTGTGTGTGTGGAGNRSRNGNRKRNRSGTERSGTRNRTEARKRNRKADRKAERGSGSGSGNAKTGSSIGIRTGNAAEKDDNLLMQQLQSMFRASAEAVPASAIAAGAHACRWTKFAAAGEPKMARAFTGTSSRDRLGLAGAGRSADGVRTAGRAPGASLQSCLGSRKISPGGAIHMKAHAMAQELRTS